MDNFDLRKYLTEGRLLKEEYNLPDSDSTTDQYVNNHWDGILKDILRAHTDLRNSKGGESIPEKPSQLDIDIVLGRFDGADEFMDVDPNVYDEYFDFYDMYLVTQRDEENTKDISVEDYPEGDYSGYTKRDDLPKLAEGKILNESAPGYDTRKFGESLPTMESVKAAYEAKKDNEEEPRDGVKSAAAKLGMKSNHIKEEDITETRDLSVKEKMDNILYVMDPVQVIDELVLAMSTDDANLYLDAIIQDHGIMDIDEANLNEEIPGSAMLKINQSVKSVSTAAKAMIDFYNQMAKKEQVDFLKNQQFKVVMDKLNALIKDKDENDEM